MKVLFVSDTYSPNVDGIYGFVQRLSLQLVKNGHIILVMVPSGSFRRTCTSTDGIEVYGVPFLNVPKYPNIRFPIPFFHRSHIKGLLVSLRPDVIHLQDHFSLARAVVFANRHIGIPMIGTNHFMPEGTGFPIPFLDRFEKAANRGWQGPTPGFGAMDIAAATNFSRAIAAGFNRQVDRWMWSSFSKLFNQLAIVTATTEKCARLIHSMLLVDVLHVPDGVDLKLFRPHWESGSFATDCSVRGMPILLHVGSLDPNTGLELLLHAVSVASVIIDICLVLAGEGEARTSLELLAVKLGIAERVVFAGDIPEIDLPKLYRSAKCFISAGSGVNQSMVFTAAMEAMACGLPVIAMNAAGMDELVSEGKSGCLYNSGDLGTVVKAILKFFQQKALAQKMGRVGARSMQERPIEKIAGVYEIIYEGVIERN